MNTNIGAYTLTGSNGDRLNASHDNPPADVRVLASDLTFIDVTTHGLAFPQRGDVCGVGNIAGVAENSVAAATEHVQLKKFGRYRFEVNGADAAAAASAVNVGDAVFFDAAVPEINVDGTNGIPLGTVVGPGDGEVIAAAAGPNTADLIIDVGLR